MRTLIENYRNLTAEHCGSGSMRNLLYHYCGLELEESVVFGLGSGLDCILHNGGLANAPSMLMGRGVSMEQDLAGSLGIDYREIIPADDQRAWEEVRDEVLAGHPTMLCGDIFYLDYRDYKVNFPGHRFVLLGFDDDKQEVYIADRTNAETETCSMEALRLSRAAPVAPNMSNLWGKFYDDTVKNSLPDACEIALRRTTQRMLGEDASQINLITADTDIKEAPFSSGVAGITQFTEYLMSWPDRTDTAACARLIDQCIAKFGSGGALFRNLFCGFMHWAHQQRPDLVSNAHLALAEKSAQQWTGIASVMQDLTQDTTNQDALSQAHQQSLAVYETERKLFESLAATFA
ncbi:MAG: BtrH N-terminal domain-containing protein [Pseudomonadales bacterium]